MKKTAEEIARIQEKLLERNRSMDVSVSMEEIESFGDRDSMVEMLKGIVSYQKMLAERITFMNESLTTVIPFTRENLYLFCAHTGSGKSTVAANISYPLWKQDKKILVISNEESKQDVILRIACIELQLDFNDYKKGRMSQTDLHNALKLIKPISQYVKVIDVSYKDGLTTKVEGVRKALESVQLEKDYSCVLIDYFQLIKNSTEDPRKSTYENLNDFRIWLGRYIKSSTMPVVLFAQLHSITKRGGARDMDTRLIECPRIVEPATVIIEIIPDYDTKISSFVVHKDRFGCAGQRIECAYEKGRFISINDDELMQRQLRAKIGASKKQEDVSDDVEEVAQDLQSATSNSDVKIDDL